MLGATILRVQVPPGLLRELSAALADASWADFRHLAHALTPLVWGYGLGSTIGATMAMGGLATAGMAGFDSTSAMGATTAVPPMTGR